MIENMINELNTVLSTVESLLQEKLKKEEDRLKFVDILNAVQAKHTFDLAKVKVLEPMIRTYIKEYSDNYRITQGRGGGVALKSTATNVVEAKKSMDKTKEDMKAIIERKVAALKEAKPVQQVVQKDAVIDEIVAAADEVDSEEFGEDGF